MSKGAAEYYWANKTDISRQLASLTHSGKCRVLGRSGEHSLCRFSTDEPSLGSRYINFKTVFFSVFTIVCSLFTIEQNS